MGGYKRKIARKEQKYEHILFSDTGINRVEVSRNIMICNAGLVSGFAEDRAVEVLSKYGSINRLLMLPNKSYCFAQFTNHNDAQDAYQSIHGKLMVPEINGPLYLLFTEKLPEMSDQLYDSNYIPDGLIIIDDFVTTTEEQQLSQLINRSSSQPDFHSGKTLKHRLVTHYGYEFCYDTNNIDITSPLPNKIPEECHQIIKRLKEHDCFKEFKSWFPDQLTINCYEPGQGIPPHIDTHSAFDNIILSLSLGSDIVMDFKQNDDKHIPVLLRRRSLLIMSNESRYAWSHGITSRKQDVIPSSNGLTVQKRQRRISFTFRRVNRGPCCCVYKDYCDSQKQLKACNNIDNSLAAQLELLHVHKVYDEIANHFSETRHKSWPNVTQFIQSLEPGSILIDIGCGNGKYFGINKLIYEMGCDRNSKLTSICARKNHQVLMCDCLYVPFRSESADACISIALIHHLATKERRIQAVKEMIRILRPNGQALIYVWAKQQKKNNVMSSYLKQNTQNKRGKDICVDNIKHVDTHCVLLSKNNENVQYSLDKISNLELHDSTTSESILQNKNQTDEDNRSQQKKLSFPIHINRTEFKHSDVLVSWKIKPDGQIPTDSNVPTFLRYYHVFSENELEHLCQSIPNITITKSYYDQGNWCIILKKCER